MKRAIALLEQTKNTMPHLPRPVSGGKDSNSSGNDSDNGTKAKGGKDLQYRKTQRRNPSASNRTRILATNNNNSNLSSENNKFSNSNVATTNGGGEMSSRKSTAVSSSTNRVGSSNGKQTSANPTGVITTSLSGSNNNNGRTQKRAAHTAGSFNATDIIMEKDKQTQQKQQQQQPLYELSLKNNSNASKKPHKLKPLGSSKLQIDNKANSILEIENAFQKEILNDIEQDLTDYLDTNQILSQMQTAFGGSSNTASVSTTLLKQTPDIKKKNKKNSGSANSQSFLGKTTMLGSGDQLDPILEEGDNNSSSMGQLVVYQPNMNLAEQRAKKNEALKRRVKMITGEGIGPTQSISSMSDISGMGSQNNSSTEADTFITGTKIVPKDSEMQVALPDLDDKMLQEYEAHMARKKHKYYKYEEDELLDDCDQHEKDMNEMLKYLTEVEELIKGQDLKSIQQMMDVTKETMSQHMQACDKFKGQIQDIDNQAEAAIKMLNFYDSDGKNIDGSRKNIGNGQLERVIEDGDEGYDAEFIDNKKNKPSHEQSKYQIVGKLSSMTQSMREFTSDLESRLDRAYKSGATKKFGYDGLTTASQQASFEIKSNKKEERALNKLHNQAQQFIEQNSASAMIKSQTPNSISSAIGRKNSGVRALPAPSTQHSSSNQLEQASGSQQRKRKGSVKNMHPHLPTNKNKQLNSDLAGTAGY